MPSSPIAIAISGRSGPTTAVTGRALTTAVAPELELPDADGKPFRLSSLRGKKVVLHRVGVLVRMPLRPARVAGTAHRAPSPQGLEIVTVGLDVDPDAARPFIEAAQA